VRETLFNWLGQDLTGLSCLDLFAGSGVLGFEAASRGAARVTLVERDARAVAALKRNAAALGAADVEIQRADALEFLALSDRSYDVVFLDPPYGKGWLERLVALLPRVLAAQAMVYVEAESQLPEFGALRRLKHRQAGQVHYHLFESDTP
jgi:16S rRNA (guanine(966)-N(2))-methyltransferase RsmD